VICSRRSGCTGQTTGIELTVFGEVAGIEYEVFDEATGRALPSSQVRWRMPNARFLVLQYERVRHTPSHPKLHTPA
jgi:hypothetical protein